MSYLHTPAQAKKIKSSLWFGELHEDIASEFSCSVPLIKNIAHGDRWPEIEWPDGSRGKLSAVHRRKIMHARRQALKELSGKLSARVKEILLAAGP